MKRSLPPHERCSAGRLAWLLQNTETALRSPYIGEAVVASLRDRANELKRRLAEATRTRRPA